MSASDSNLQLELASRRSDTIELNDIRVLICVPENLEKGGTILFARRLQAELVRRGLTVVLAEINHQTESLSSTKLSFASPLNFFDWLDANCEGYSVIIWAGFFDDDGLKSTQIDFSTKFKRLLSKTVIVMWESPGPSQSRILEPDQLDRLYGSAADAIIALNEEQEYFLVNHGVPASMVHVIPTGVNVDSDFTCPTPFHKINGRFRWKLPADKVIALSAARFVVRKRQDFIIESWLAGPELRQHQLVLFGSGFGSNESIEYRVRQLAQECKDIRVIPFHDSVDRSSLYRVADLFVSGSSAEGEPIALVEAMACGLPAVVTDISGHRHLVKHGINGFLYDVDDDQAFRRYVSMLVSDPSMRIEFGMAARRLTERTRGIQSVADSYCKLLPVLS